MYLESISLIFVSGRHFFVAQAKNLLNCFTIKNEKGEKCLNPRASVWQLLQGFAMEYWTVGGCAYVKHKFHRSDLSAMIYPVICS